MTELAPLLRDALSAGERVILVSIARAQGSTPREAGATMLVTANRAVGTIGGGQLEFHAIDMAREMIAADECERRLDIPLGPHLGQCCGGRVELLLRRAGRGALAALAAREARAERDRPQVLVFGAGHVGLAIVRALALLPYSVTLLDDREAQPERLPEKVVFRKMPDPELIIRAAQPLSAYVILTHSHALDYRLADAALRRSDANYVGMIGSATKRARFEHWFLARGGAPELLKSLVSPIGEKVHDKRPEIIAALASAEIVTHFCQGAKLARATESSNGRQPRAA